MIYKQIEKEKREDEKRELFYVSRSKNYIEKKNLISFPTRKRRRKKEDTGIIKTVLWWKNYFAIKFLPVPVYIFCIPIKIGRDLSISHICISKLRKKKTVSFRNKKKSRFTSGIGCASWRKQQQIKELSGYFITKKLQHKNIVVLEKNEEK